jgi:hypothetical protein
MFLDLIVSLGLYYNSFYVAVSQEARICFIFKPLHPSLIFVSGGAHLSALSLTTDKLQLEERNLGRVFNSRSCRVHALHLHFSETKQPYLKLKTRLKQLLGSLPLVIALPGFASG